MDPDSSISGLIAIGVLLLVQATLTMAYAALVNARRNDLRERADGGDRRAKGILALTGDATPALQITYLLLTTVLRLVIAAVVILTLSQPFLIANPAIPPVLGHGFALLLAATLILILGDIVPEAVGSVYTTPLALLLVRPMYLIVMFLRPVTLSLLLASRLVSSLFGSDRLTNTVTEEEILTLVDAGHSGGTIEEEEKEMIYSVLQLDQTLAREVMTPRMDIIAVEIEATLEEALAKFVESGFSRIPIYEDTIDNVSGLLYAKDLLRYWRHNGQTDTSMTIRELLRPAHFVPESKRADELLKEIQSRKVHMVIVVDEYGGTAGLVTIEDMLEEIVGDIQDEYDFHEEDEYIELGSDEYIVDASMDLDDFNELLDINLPTEDSDTLGGYIFVLLGRLPVGGEVMETDDLTLRVDTLEGRRIRKVWVKHKSRDAAAAEKETNLTEHHPTTNHAEVGDTPSAAGE